MFADDLANTSVVTVFVMFKMKQLDSKRQRAAVLAQGALIKH